MTERRPFLRWEYGMQEFGFEFEVEAFEKAAPDGQERRIGGIISTEHLDRQNEVLLQDGLDFSPFLKGGWFNDNHDQATDALVGYPDKVERRTLPDGRKATYVEGYLLKNSSRANAIWDIATSLQKSGRKLGFSVEGGIVDRVAKGEGGVVRKAIVREVAITRCPVNTHTQMEVLAKSLAAGTGPAPANTPVSGPDGGAAVMAPESLEASGKKRKRKKLKKSEAIALLCHLRPSLSREAATQIVEFAIRHHSAA